MTHTAGCFAPGRVQRLIAAPRALRLGRRAARPVSARPTTAVRRSKPGSTPLIRPPWPGSPFLFGGYAAGCCGRR